MAGEVAFVLGFALAVAVFLQHAAGQTVHVVGDTTGWTVPTDGAAFYSNWAANKKFVVGDSLSFNFRTDTHDVLEVSKESFDACNGDNAIGNVITTGPATLKLNSAGVHYYICTVGRHCVGGQKLSITVVSPTQGAMPPSSGTPRPPARTSPEGSHGAPTPDGPPSMSPPQSSSHALYATFYVTLSAIVLSLFRI